MKVIFYSIILYYINYNMKTDMVFELRLRRQITIFWSTAWARAWDWDWEDMDWDETLWTLELTWRMGWRALPIGVEVSLFRLAFGMLWTDQYIPVFRLAGEWRGRRGLVQEKSGEIKSKLVERTEKSSQMTSAWKNDIDHTWARKSRVPERMAPQSGRTCTA